MWGSILPLQCELPEDGGPGLPSAVPRVNYLLWASLIPRPALAQLSLHDSVPLTTSGPQFLWLDPRGKSKSPGQSENSVPWDQG